MAETATDSGDVHRAYEAEVRRATGLTALIAVGIAIVALPIWIAFDYLVEPTDAHLFSQIRLWLELPLLALGALVFTRFGRRHPEPLILIGALLIQGSIAFMLVRADSGFGAYALGMSLMIYAAAFLLIWSWRWTAGLIGVTWASLAVAGALAPDPLTGSEIAAVAFYLGTASAIALGGQYVRGRAAWRTFEARVELEREQRLSRELLVRLERLSREDPLTGVFNRRCWDEALARELERARRHAAPLTVVLCDLDALKEINDRFGHATGDGVLRQLAQLIGATVRKGDLVARLGGDEFAVLCPDTTEAAAAALAERLRAQVTGLRRPELDGQGVTVSIGVAGNAGRAESPDDLMARADNRLYRAKRLRNAVCDGREDPLTTAGA